MFPHYGSILTIADEKTYNIHNHPYQEVFSSVRSYIGIVPRTIIIYFFIPFTKTEMCHQIGKTNCILIKIYSIYYLIVIGILGIVALIYFLNLSNRLTNGWKKNIVIFIRNNLIGLIFGNIVGVTEANPID